MNRPSPAAIGCLSRIGLATLIAGGTFLALIGTLLVPPWVEAVSQRQVGLYVSHHVKVKEQHFVGYDFLFSDSKWQRTGPVSPPASGQTFDVTEHRICWPVLLAEWSVVVLGALGLLVVLSRRLRIGTVLQHGAAASPLANPEGEP